MTKDNQKKNTLARSKKGIVVSDKMGKTIVVEVNILKTLKKYHKKYKSTKKYSVHDENNSFKVGDEVVFEECRPVSKKKKWVVKDGKKKAEK